MDTLELRRKIAREYCQTVLWIDDQINPTAPEAADRTEYLSFFAPIAEEIISEGVVCQLQGFSQSTGNDDPYGSSNEEIEKCFRIASKADILILDWHLGAEDQRHSIEIINKLIDLKGSRFVILLSQAEDLEREFIDSLGSSFPKKTAEWYSNEAGVFVLLLQKRNFRAEGQGTVLLQAIFEQLARAYPDHLHWAAIEMAVRIKSYTPKWLQNLPSNTDLGILCEAYHSSEDVGSALLENLFEDLKEAVEYSAIKNLEDSSLTHDNSPLHFNFLEKVRIDLAVLDQEETDKSLATMLRQVVPGIASMPLDSGNRKTSAKLLSNPGVYPSIQSLKESVDAFGEFCEMRSVGVSSLQISRGSILMNAAEDVDGSRIFICVSQACDCIRDTNLLFLRGEAKGENHKTKPSETFLRFNKFEWVVRPKAECLASFDVHPETRILSGYNVVGRLRESSLERILNRVWRQITRVGTNQPRFLRESRDERE